MDARQECESLITDFLSRGGRIRKLPDAQPKSINEVIEYLETSGLPVEVVRMKNGVGSVYVCRERTMNVEQLVSFANGHRKRRRLAPLQVKIPV
jgi:hypothetical protein